MDPQLRIHKSKEANKNKEVPPDGFLIRNLGQSADAFSGGVDSDILPAWRNACTTCCRAGPLSSDNGKFSKPGASTSALQVY